jgi:hypothetical protein
LKKCARSARIRHLKSKLQTRKAPRGRNTNKTLHSRCQSARSSTSSEVRDKLWVSRNLSGIHNKSISGRWWRQTGSNRRPEACKATALPTELCPQLFFPGVPAEARFNQSAFAHRASADTRLSLRERRVVGLGGLEPPTSRLSSARSNQLSYRPSFKNTYALLCDQERET